METKAKKKTFNIIMVALIALIVVCGIMLVGHIQGWFGGGGAASQITSTEITGVVNMERSGVGYTLDKDVDMQSGDIVETKNGSEAIFEMGKNNLSVNEKTEMEMPITSFSSMHPYPGILTTSFAPSRVISLRRYLFFFIA